MQFKVLRILCSSTKPCSQVWIKDLTNSLKGLCYLRKLQHELAAEFSWETSTFPKFISHLNSLIRHGIAACSHRIETPTNDAWDSISDFQEQPYWLISHVIIMNSIEHRPLCPCSDCMIGEFINSMQNCTRKNVSIFTPLWRLKYQSILIIPSLHSSRDAPFKQGLHCTMWEAGLLISCSDWPFILSNLPRQEFSWQTTLI